MNISDKYKLIFFHYPKCAGKSVISSLEIKTSDKTNLESGFRQTTLLGLDYWHWNGQIYPEKWKEYKKFTIIRNPWDRVVSLYNFRKKENDLYKLLPPIFNYDVFGGDKLGPDGLEWGFKRWVLSIFIKGMDYSGMAPSTDVLDILKFDSTDLNSAKNIHHFFVEGNAYVDRCTSQMEIPIQTPGGHVTTSYPVSLVRERMEWFNQIDVMSGLKNEILVDNILRFEYLEEDWNTMFENFGYEPPKLPKKNVSKHKHYSEYYDDETREFVSYLFKRDIDAFGYKFENRK